MEISAVEKHLSSAPCCGWRLKKLHERILIRINDQDSVAVLIHPYKYFLAANRSLGWFGDIVDGIDVLSNSTLKIYLRNRRQRDCPRRCNCCCLLHMSDRGVAGPLPRRASACGFIKHCATLGTRRPRCQRARGHAAAPKLIPAKNGLFFFNYSGFIGQLNFDLGSSGGPLALCGITY